MNEDKSEGIMASTCPYFDVNKKRIIRVKGDSVVHMIEMCYNNKRL